MPKSFFYGNTILLRRPGVANFAVIIKVAMNLIKTTFKNSVKVRIIIDYVLNL